jgi:hypothetical protein
MRRVAEHRQQIGGVVRDCRRTPCRQADLFARQQLQAAQLVAGAQDRIGEFGVYTPMHLELAQHGVP